MQYIILLRGVNVGGRTIKMAELKQLLENNGYEGVQTILQTGNAIIDTNELSIVKTQTHIESILSNAFSYQATLQIITPKTLQAILKNFPYKNLSSEEHAYIVFTQNQFENTLVQNCGALDNNLEEVAVGASVVYWRVCKGLTLESTFGKYLAKASKIEFTTTRNKNTLEKIIAKCKV